MFQKKIDEFFNDIPNVFGIADDILIAGFNADGRDHDVRLEQVLRRCRHANLELNKDNFIQVNMNTICGKVISRHGVSPDPARVKVLMDKLQPKTEQNCSHFWV